MVVFFICCWLDRYLSIFILSEYVEKKGVSIKIVS